MTHLNDTVPYGFCHCGCGQKTPLSTENRPTRGYHRGKPMAYVRGHNSSHMSRMTVNCVICGTPFTIGACYVNNKKACESPDCRTERRRRTSTGIDRKGEWCEVTCFCGCNTIYSVPIYDFRNNRTGQFWLTAEHRRQWEAERREERGINTAGVTRYGSEWPRLIHEVRTRDKVCQQCGKTPAQNKRALDVHHIVPFRLGGPNDLSNLVALCRSCHGTHTGKEGLPPLPLPRARYEKACIICGTDFVTTMNRVIACSEPCRQEQRKHVAKQWYLRKGEREGPYWRHQNAATT